MKYTDIAKAALVLVLGVMTSTAFADNIYGEGFESIDSTTNILAAAPSVTPPWSGGADDVSTVVAGTPTLPGIGYPLTGAHNKVLQLNTEGGTLTNTLTAGPADFSTANIYVDTLVKFVPSEDLADFGTDQDIKVAAYALIQTETVEEVEVTTTNLVIYHGVYDITIADPFFRTTNTVTDIPIDADGWYRLTIKLANGSGDNTMQAFTVSLNGVTLTNAVAYQDDWSARVNDEENSTPNTGPWFISAACTGSIKDSVASLQFKGTGFIDDLVVTTDEPSFEMGAGFEVTQYIGANGTSSDPTSPIEVTGGSTSLTYTASDFYKIASLTTNDVEVAGAAGTKAATIVLDGATAVVASFSRLDAYSAGDVAWFNENEWSQASLVANDAALSYDTMNLLNVAPTNATANGVLTISEIVVTANGDVHVTVHIDRTVSLGAINGNLCLYGWAAMGDTPELIGDADVSGESLGTGEDIDKEFSLTEVQADGMKFFKAVIEWRPAVE